MLDAALRSGYISSPKILLKYLRSTFTGRMDFVVTVNLPQYPSIIMQSGSSPALWTTTGECCSIHPLKLCFLNTEIEMLLNA